jgi:hypothetical protein
LNADPCGSGSETLDLTQILILTKFDKEIVFKSSVLAWIRIRNRMRNWIRTRIEQKMVDPDPY